MGTWAPGAPAFIGSLRFFSMRENGGYVNSADLD
jgi:hypothetical protein